MCGHWISSKKLKFWSNGSVAALPDTRTYTCSTYVQRGIHWLPLWITGSWTCTTTNSHRCCHQKQIECVTILNSAVNMIDASLRTQAVIVHLHVVIIMSITRNSIAISRIILSTLDLYAFSFKLCSTVKEYCIYILSSISVPLVVNDHRHLIFTGPDSTKSSAARLFCAVEQRL